MEQRAQDQRETRKKLEAELAELMQRKDVATRRLAAHETEISGNPSVWLGTPSEIKAMKQRLTEACTDNDVVMKLVEELRELRDSLTNEAINYFAQAEKR